MNKKNLEEIDKLFHDVAGSIAETLVRKNHDYGDSVYNVYEQFGDVSTYIRLSDKLGRLQNLVKKVDMRVDESIEDVYRDIAGYCILTLVSRMRLDDSKVKEEETTDVTDDPFMMCGRCHQRTLIREAGIQQCGACGMGHFVKTIQVGNETHYHIDPYTRGGADTDGDSADLRLIRDPIFDIADALSKAYGKIVYDGIKIKSDNKTGGFTGGD